MRIARVSGVVLGLVLAGAAMSAGAAAVPPAQPGATTPPASARPASPAAPVVPPVAGNVPAGAGDPQLGDDGRPVPARIPNSAFAARAFISAPVLSPDGMHFVARTQIDGKMQPVIFDLTGKIKPIAFSLPPHIDLVRYFWAGNNLVVFDVGEVIPWEGDETHSTRLIAYDLTSGKSHIVGSDIAGPKGDDILWIDPAGKTILLAYQRSIYEEPSVSSVDLETNHSTVVVKPREDTWDWYADNTGVVRYAYAWSDEHHWQMIYRSAVSQPFKVVAKGTDRDNDDEDKALDNALRIQAGSDEGYAFGRDKASGLRGVYRYNFATHTRGDKVFEAPDADIDDAVLNEDGTAMLAAWWTDSRDRIKWWDPARAEFQQNVDKAVGDHEAWVVSRSRTAAQMIVWVGASNDPGSYYLYQDATGRMTRIAQIADSLNPPILARSQYVHFPARDGTQIPAYLTLPVGRPAKNLPLVVMPHGGPYGVRDNGGYDDDVQFLANRGYVVLQPQYRGSGSYGTHFDELGNAQWGRAMQDDIDDGMDWLVRLGVADAKRVCLVGASYGGYAALWGATRNPERYRCAVSLAGVSDMPRLLKYQLNSSNDRQWREQWRAKVQGAADFDLKSISPLFAVSRLAVPVMLVHGDKDSTVPIRQSQLYADALTAAGKPHEFYTLPGEGHGLSTTANAQVWYDRLDAFLAKYNPADPVHP